MQLHSVLEVRQMPRRFHHHFGETIRRLSARVHTLETINTELTERLELLESDDQPTAQGYSPDNRSPTEAEMTVLLPPTEINKRGNKT